MRAIGLTALLVVGTAHADPSASPPSRDAWVAACEAQLRAAAAVYQPKPTAYDRWEWHVADHGVTLRHEVTVAELLFEVTAAPTSEKSHPWRTDVVRNKQFPEVVDEIDLTRVVRGRAVTFRAAGMAGLKERDAFVKVFRPALESCVGH